MKAWVDATQICQSFHPAAHLVVINNAEEQSAIDEILASNNGQFHFGYSLHCLT